MGWGWKRVEDEEEEGVAGGVGVGKREGEE